MSDAVEIEVAPPRKRRPHALLRAEVETARVLAANTANSGRKTS